MTLGARDVPLDEVQRVSYRATGVATDAAALAAARAQVASFELKLGADFSSDEGGRHTRLHNLEEGEPAALAGIAENDLVENVEGM